MTNIEKVKVDVAKVNELLDDEGDLTSGNCLEFNKQDHKIVADFKPFGVTDET